MNGRRSRAEEFLTEEALERIEEYARDKLPDKEIAKRLCISERTFAVWKNKYPAFTAALKKGRTQGTAEVEDNLRQKKLTGYFVTETTTEEIVHHDSDGNVTGTTVHTKEVQRYIPPDTTAMIFYLKCRLPDKYNDKLNLKLDTSAKELPKLYLALGAVDSEDNTDSAE